MRKLGAALKELFAVAYPPEILAERTRRDVRNMLRYTHDEAGTEIWLRSPNRNLGGQSPWALIDMGEYDRVLAESRRVGGEG